MALQLRRNLDIIMVEGWRNGGEKDYPEASVVRAVCEASLNPAGVFGSMRRLPPSVFQNRRIDPPAGQSMAPQG